MAEQFAFPAFIISIVGLIVAAIGAFTGIVALTWQIATRTRGAHRVKVSTATAIYTAGIDDVLLAVTATNVGAAGVELEAWGFDVPGGQTVHYPHVLPGTTPLPHRLEAGTSASFYIRADDLAEIMRSHGLSSADVHAFVRLGTGQKIRDRKGINLHEDFYR